MLRRDLAMLVVIDSSLTLLLLGETDAIVKVEISAEGRGPWTGPAYPPLVPMEFGERRSRCRPVPLLP